MVVNVAMLIKFHFFISWGSPLEYWTVKFINDGFTTGRLIRAKEEI